MQPQTAHIHRKTVSRSVSLATHGKIYKTNSREKTNLPCRRKVSAMACALKLFKTKSNDSKFTKLMPKSGKVEFTSTVKPVYDNSNSRKIYNVNFREYFSELRLAIAYLR